jgi:endoglucanase
LKTARNTYTAVLIGAITLSTLAACARTSSSIDTDPKAVPLIKLNQIGFLPNNSKVAVVPADGKKTFEIIDANTKKVMYSGQLSSPKNWEYSQENVRLADFSAVTRPGNYRLRVAGIDSDVELNISQDAFVEIHDAALKAYYYNRASTALEEKYASPWHRKAGHLDTQVKVHTSAADKMRPAGTVISSPKGWYDAGDYNKYIVNSGISTYTLLEAYSHFSNFYQKRDINIPESGNDLPDILDEIQWNIDWMMTMQDPNDGGVYHKLTTLNFSAASMPIDADKQRYVVQKSTTAALNFAAVLANASRVYSAFDSHKALSREYADAALDAWKWAQKNPEVEYTQPDDVHTGEYGDKMFDDERLWAAAELFVLTQDPEYLASFKNIKSQPGAALVVPSWQNVSALAYLTLLNHEAFVSKADANLYTQIKQDFLVFTDNIVQQHKDSAYAVAMQANDFVWGSNAVALNKAMLLLNAYNHVPKAEYKVAANALVDYVLGRNPTDFSFVTGFGTKTVMDPHHRQSYSDGILAPVPGFVAGGPQPKQQDGCDYPSDLPAKSFLDDWCSYSTNEVTINWNAPLVYSLAALHVKQ